MQLDPAALHPFSACATDGTQKQSRIYNFAVISRLGGAANPSNSRAGANMCTLNATELAGASEMRSGSG